MELTEKVAYLKGLMDGLGFDDTSKEGKVLTAVADILEDMALAISDLEDGMDLMTDQIEELDEDLEEVMAETFGWDDDEDEDDDFEGELYEVTCPSCGDVICVDEDMLDEGEIECPGCGENLEFDFDGPLEECDCGHDHSHDEKKSKK
jgi:ribosomal protein S27E